MSSIIEVKGLKKNFGSLQVLKGIDAAIEENEVVCIIGPSGSGKSTFLRCLNRLEEITDGEILIDGVHLSKENENEVRTEMGMVFQSFNLFPHMSVLDNVTIGPRKVRRIDRKEAEKKALELLGRVSSINCHTRILSPFPFTERYLFFYSIPQNATSILQISVL